MFDSPSRIVLGLLAGFAFGWLLQKGRVSDRRVIVGQFLLRDFTVLKVMLTAVIVGGIGVYAMNGAGIVDLHVKPAQLGAIALGGAIFGIGMVVLGYCPGTVVAAAGEGKPDAWWGILGGVIGAAVFAEIATYLAPLLGWANLGTVTLPDVTGVSPWLYLAGLAAIAIPFFRWLERRGL